MCREVAPTTRAIDTAGVGKAAVKALAVIAKSSSWYSKIQASQRSVACCTSCRLYCNIRLEAASTGVVCLQAGRLQKLSYTVMHQDTYRCQDLVCKLLNSDVVGSQLYWSAYTKSCSKTIESTDSCAAIVPCGCLQLLCSGAVFVAYSSSSAMTSDTNLYNCIIVCQWWPPTVDTAPIMRYS